MFVCLFYESMYVYVRMVQQLMTHTNVETTIFERTIERAVTTDHSLRAFEFPDKRGYFPAKMGENTVQVLTIMDDHLKAIERSIKGALNRLEAAGGKIDDEFMNYFEEKTVDW